jgi:hypothetical protein
MVSRLVKSLKNHRLIKCSKLVGSPEGDTRMVVRLQTAEGKIKKYDTVSKVDGGYGQISGLPIVDENGNIRPKRTKNVTISTVQYV